MAAIDLEAMAYFGESDRTVGYYAPYLSGPATGVDKREIAAARVNVQRDIAHGTAGVAYIKTHNAMITDRGVPTINRGVSAGAVYLIRNPLDIAVSWARFRDVSVDEIIATMAREGYETEPNENDVHVVYGSWSQNVRSWTASPNPVVLVVRYEDMLASAERTFAEIARHLRIAATPEQLSRAIALSSFEKLQSAERATGFVEKPPEAELFFREGRAGQWKEALSATQVARIVADHGEQMARFGYLPDAPTG